MKELEKKLKENVLKAINEKVSKEEVKVIMWDYVLEYRKNEFINKQEMENYLGVVEIYLKYMKG